MFKTERILRTTAVLLNLRDHLSGNFMVLTLYRCMYVCYLEAPPLDAFML